MRSRPLPVTLAAILLALIWRAELVSPVVPNGRDTSGCRLLSCCSRRCGPPRRRRFMDAQKVGHLAHHCCLCA
jgi:hypothetical protein